MKGFAGGGMAQLMKQANQMQLKIKKTQEEIAQRAFEGTAGGGAVKVTVNGDHLLQSVFISPDLLKSQDAEMIQDLILVASNEAIKAAKEVMSKEIEKIGGGINLPGLF